MGPYSWRKDEDGLPTRRHCLIVARNVLTGEVKHFLSNRVPGERNPVSGKYVTLRWLLRVAFGRWSIESCFREGKEELGLDHYEGSRLALRASALLRDATESSFLCRMRQEYDGASGESRDRLTVEQVRSAMNAWLEAAGLPPSARRKRLREELKTQQYHQRRNKQARTSHRKTRNCTPEGPGNRHQQDQVLHYRRATTMTYSLPSTPLTTNNVTKVALSN